MHLQFYKCQIFQTLSAFLVSLSPPMFNETLALACTISIYSGQQTNSGLQTAQISIVLEHVVHHPFINLTHSAAKTSISSTEKAKSKINNSTLEPLHSKTALISSPKQNNSLQQHISLKQKELNP